MGIGGAASIVGIRAARLHGDWPSLRVCAMEQKHYFFRIPMERKNAFFLVNCQF